MGLFNNKKNCEKECFGRFIPLDVWQDPQGDVLLKISEHECFVYFGCWDENGEPADYLAKLTFDCKEARYCKTDFLPYKTEEPYLKSYIVKIDDSEWLREYILRKVKRNPNMNSPDKTWDGKPFEHFIVKGHDVFVEIIASHFIVEKVYASEAGELKYLIDNA